MSQLLVEQRGACYLSGMELFRVIPVENGFWALERLQGGQSLGLVPCYFLTEDEARFRMERLVSRFSPAQV